MTANKRTTGWRKKQIMEKLTEQEQEKRDPLEVVQIVVEALDDAYAAGVRNSSKRPEWVGLTDKEIREAMNSWAYSQLAMTHAEWVYAVQRATEAKLKEKNGYA